MPASDSGATYTSGRRKRVRSLALFGHRDFGKRSLSSREIPQSQPLSRYDRLTIQLGTIPLSGNQSAFGIFYKFSTKEIPRANGLASRPE
jgi:hypothetical protein